MSENSVNSSEDASNNDSVQELVKNCLSMKPVYQNSSTKKTKAPTKSESLRMTLRSSTPRMDQQKNGDSNGKRDNDNKKKNVDDVFSDFKSDIQNLCAKFDNVYSIMVEAIDNIVDLEQKHDELSDTVDVNSNRIRDLEEKFDDLDRKQRLNKALLTCNDLDTESATWKKKVTDLLTNKLKVEKSHMSGIGISKFGKSKNTVLLEFISMQTKRNVLAIKRNAADSQDLNNIFVNDFLTPKNLELLKAARELKKKKLIHAAFSAGGLVYIKQTENDDGTLIKSKNDLPNDQ